MSVIHIDALLTPKKKRLHCLWPEPYFASYQILQYIDLQGCKQIPSLRQIVSLLRENINIFINVTYLYMLHVCIYKIHNMIRLLYKSKISYKIFVWNQVSLLLKGLMIFISNL